MTLPRFQLRGATGLEPTASWVAGKRFEQLNHTVKTLGLIPGSLPSVSLNPLDLIRVELGLASTPIGDPDDSFRKT